MMLSNPGLPADLTEASGCPLLPAPPQEKERSSDMEGAMKPGAEDLGPSASCLTNNLTCACLSLKWDLKG